MKKRCLLFFFIFLASFLHAQSGQVSEGCEISWRYTAHSECRGQEMITSADVNGDGKEEIFVGAGSPDGAYWYMLEYLPEEGIYWPRHISEDLGFLNLIKAIDLSGQGGWRIFIPLSSGEVKQFEGATLEPLPSLFLPGAPSTLTNIFQLDADGDGDKEVIFITTSSMYIYDSSLSLQFSHQFELGAINTAIANVDDDPALEIIRESGPVLELSYDYIITRQWTFSTEGGFNSYAYAGDVDGDSRAEIVHATAGKIRIYDAELQSLQSEIPIANSFSRSHPVFLADVNDNGRQEIITYYLANFNDPNGGIACYDALTGDTLWTAIGNYQGARSMHIADADDDGEAEILWWNACASGDGGRLHIAGLESHTVEYSMPKKLNGPYLGFDIGDVGLDDQPELIFAPQTGVDNPQGYADNGLLYVIDPVTHDFKWSNSLNGGPFFTYSNRATALKIARTEEDGENEIFFATDSLQYPVIYRLAPTTFEVRQKYVLDPGMTVIDLAVDDVDGDGQREVAALSTYYSSLSTGKFLFVFDAITGEREWAPPGVGFRVFHSSAIRVGNVDQDDAPEIVLIKDSLIVYDGITHEKLGIRDNFTNDFYALDLYDFDGDGAQEIVTGLGTRVLILDGATLSPLDTITIPGNPNQKVINAIRVADLNQNGLPELVISDQNQIFYATPAGKVIEGPRLGSGACLYNRLLVANMDNDPQQELVAINDYAILQLETDCVECLYFDLLLETQQPTCLPNSGAVAAIPIGLEGQSFSYLWNTGDTTAILSGMEAGLYSVTVSSSGGCQLEGQVVLSAPRLILDVRSSPDGCDSLGAGTATVEIEEGLPPYEYAWSNGDTASIADSLSAGLYTLAVTDANFCTATDTLLIEESRLSGIFSFINPVACNGEPTGAVMAIPQGGNGPYQFSWSNGDTTRIVDSLPAGDYHLTTLDVSSGCIWRDSVAIQAASLAIEASGARPACNGEPFGRAQIEVLEGTPPYTLQWPSMVFTGNNTSFNAPPGANFATVRDFWGCIVTNDYIIGTHEIGFELIIDSITCQGAADGIASVQVSEGTPPYTYEWSTGDTALSITGLGPGAYSVILTDSTSCSLEKGAILAEPPALILNIVDIIPDNPASPEAEGMVVVEITGGTPPYTVNWTDATGAPADPEAGFFSGSHTLTVNDANGCTVSEVITIPIVSAIDERLAIDKIRLYPNPTGGALRLEAAAPQNAHFRVQLFGQLGQLIHQKEGNLFANGKWEEDFSKFPGGSYFLRLSTAGASRVWRVEMIR